MSRQDFPVAWEFHHSTLVERYQLATTTRPGAAARFKEYPSAPLLMLPAAEDLAITLDNALRRRLSCRHFRADPLELATIATLLSASYGINGTVLLGEHEMLTRAAPSGGGLYPLELYLLVRRVTSISPGLYHYAALSHALELLSDVLPAAWRLLETFLGQPYVLEAPLIVVFSGVLDRSLHKYGDRGYRLILLEAGHAMQILNLAAVALDCGSVNLGGFFDRDLATMLAIDIDSEPPLYAVAIGKPQQVDEVALRQP